MKKTRLIKKNILLQKKQTIVCETQSKVVFEHREKTKGSRFYPICLSIRVF